MIASGDSYRSLIIRAEIISWLANGQDSSSNQITIQPRLVGESVEPEIFDLHVATQPAVLITIIQRLDESLLRQWLALVETTAVSERPDFHANFTLIYSEVAEGTDMLKLLDSRSNSAMTVRLHHRPWNLEERLAVMTARHICRDPGRAAELNQRVAALVIGSARGGHTLVLSDLTSEIASHGIALRQPSSLEPDLRADAFNRAQGRCCVCHKVAMESQVRFINGLSSDHDPDNLAVICSECWNISRSAAEHTPSREVDRLIGLRRDWDWQVAQVRRQSPESSLQRRTGQRQAQNDHILQVLRDHLSEDFHWDGPRRGEFARLGGRMEDRFYQANRGERLTARPAYYHNYWGLVGSKLLLPELFPAMAALAANAVADRLAETGWITVNLEDYSAPPSLGRRRVQTIRHTARAAMILLLADSQLPSAADVAWNIISEAEASMSSEGGWREFRGEPEAPPTLYSSLYVLQLLASICLDQRWENIIPELTSFKEQAASLTARVWHYMFDGWQVNRWSMGGMPWIVNAAAILADVGIYAPSEFAEEFRNAFRAAITPSGRLIDPQVGAEWDAPEPVLAIRVSFAMAQLDRAAQDERLNLLRERLSRSPWDNAPLRTMDVAFLALLLARGSDSGRVEVNFSQTSADELFARGDRGRAPVVSDDRASGVRAFVSYVREDAATVDRLVYELRSRGVEVWLDRQNLVVGDDWKARIRDAIRDGDYFLACFSPAYLQRSHTYMNEELLVAIEELRLRPSSHKWFLPTTLGSDVIPDIPISASRTLRDIHHVDLLADWDSAIAGLIRVLTSKD